MSRLTVFLDSSEPGPERDQTFTLPPRESHHLIRVLRARRGETVSVLDGKGHTYTTRVAEPDPKAALLALVRADYTPSPDPPLILAQAIPKRKAWEEILRCSAELGVARIVPLITANSERQAETKSDKWTAILQDACKQSGNPWTPEIAPLRNLAGFLEDTAASRALGCVASLNPGSGPLWSALDDRMSRQTSPWIGLVGPEGDFSPDEYALIEAAGFVAASLGSTILRSSTAALVLISGLRLLRDRARPV